MEAENRREEHMRLPFFASMHAFSWLFDKLTEQRSEVSKRVSRAIRAKGTKRA